MLVNTVENFKSEECTAEYEMFKKKRVHLADTLVVKLAQL